MLMRKLTVLAQASPGRFHGVAIVSLKDNRWKEPEYLIDSGTSIVDTSGNKPKYAYPLQKRKWKQAWKEWKCFQTIELHITTNFNVFKNKAKQTAAAAIK